MIGKQSFGSTVIKTLNFGKTLGMMKKIILSLCAFSMIGCYNHIPKKVYEHPHMYAFDVWVEAQWDQNYPVKGWEAKINLGQTYTGWNGISYIVTVNPENENQVILKCTPLDR